MTTFGWTLFIYPGKQKIYFKVLSSVKRQRSRVRNSPCEQKEAEYICGYVKRLLKNIKNSVKEEKINLFTVHFVSEPVVTWPCYWMTGVFLCEIFSILWKAAIYLCKVLNRSKEGFSVASNENRYFFLLRSKHCASKVNNLKNIVTSV